MLEAILWLCAFLFMAIFTGFLVVDLVKGLLKREPVMMTVIILWTIFLWCLIIWMGVAG